jgi:hypothetical protein
VVLGTLLGFAVATAVLATMGIKPLFAYWKSARQTTT